MATITNALVRTTNGQTVKSDCFGNNIAVECPACLSYPVLIIARSTMRGSSADNPSPCRRCGARWYITDNLEQDQLPVINLAVVK
jgi:hypothetical protein